MIGSLKRSAQFRHAATEESDAPIERSTDDESFDAEEAPAEPLLDADLDRGEIPSPKPRHRRTAWARVLIRVVLPAVALVLAIAAGYFKWQDGSARDAQTAAAESVRAATDGTITMLSYRPDTVEKDLSAARDRLTGAFRDSYAALVSDVVIPGSKEKKISAVATVPAASSVSASENHAVVLVFVNQTIVIGSDAPSGTTSTVRVTLDKRDGQWLISDFTPV